MPSPTPSAPPSQGPTGSQGEQTADAGDSGEQSGQSGQQGSESAGDSDQAGDSGELVFNENEGMGDGESAGDALPDFSEEESLEESMESFEDAMESAAADAQQGQAGGGMPGPQGSDRPGDSSEAGGGVMTTAEQVAILDEQLNRGTADFDDVILQEREVIRRTASNGPAGSAETQGSGGSASTSSGGQPGAFDIPPMAGTGGSPSYDQEIPEQVAVYAPPADIPDGTDDDVVARQLREAAMREPDPELREKLWDEYRKYKGID